MDEKEHQTIHRVQNETILEVLQLILKILDRIDHLEHITSTAYNVLREDG